MEDKDRVFGLITASKRISKGKLKKELGWDSDKVNTALTELFNEGLIKVRGSNVVPVGDVEAEEVFLERNVDMGYLKRNVNLTKVNTLIKEKFGYLVEAKEGLFKVSAEKADDVLDNVKKTWEHTDREIGILERDIQNLFMLYGSLQEIMNLKREFDRKISEKLKK